MQISELKTAAKEGREGCYLFCGEEDYLKRHYIGAFREAVVTDESFAPFNEILLEGAAPDYGALLDALKAPPMMADKKLIVWRSLLVDGMKEKDLAAFAAFLGQVPDYPGNVLIFSVPDGGMDPGTAKKPSRAFRTLDKAAHVVNFELCGDGPLESWLVRHAAKEGVTFAPGCPGALIARAGHRMEVLSREVDKLCCFVQAAGQTVITPEILQRVASHTVESDAFSLTNALLDGKPDRALEVLGEMRRRRVEPVMVLGQVSRMFCDMLGAARLAEEGMAPADVAKKLSLHPYVAGLYLKAARKTGIPGLRRLVTLCAEADAALKSGNGSYGGLERLIAACARG